MNRTRICAQAQRCRYLHAKQAFLGGKALGTLLEHLCSCVKLFLSPRWQFFSDEVFDKFEQLSSIIRLQRRQQVAISNVWSHLAPHEFALVLLSSSLIAGTRYAKGHACWGRGATVGAR